jgi:hypothetical protein
VSWRLGNNIRLRSQNKCAALENLSDSKDINWAWENIKENIEFSDTENLCLYELNVKYLHILIKWELRLELKTRKII